MSTLIAFWTPGPFEMLVIGIVAILLFGRRLPEVARSLGRGLTEFKRGLRDDPTDTPAADANRIETPTAGTTVEQADDDEDHLDAPDAEPAGDEHPPA